MGDVLDETRRFEYSIGGEPVQDVAASFSTESEGDFADNGKPVDGPWLPGRSPLVGA